MIKEKYIIEKFDIYYDGAGSIFYGLNTKQEEEVDVSNLNERAIKTIISKHQNLLDKLLEINKKYDIQYKDLI